MRHGAVHTLFLCIYILMTSQTQGTAELLIIGSRERLKLVVNPYQSFVIVHV